MENKIKRRKVYIEGNKLVITGSDEYSMEAILAAVFENKKVLDIVENELIEEFKITTVMVNEIEKYKIDYDGNEIIFSVIMCEKAENFDLSDCYNSLTCKWYNFPLHDYETEYGSVYKIEYKEKVYYLDDLKTEKAKYKLIDLYFLWRCYSEHARNMWQYENWVERLKEQRPTKVVFKNK